MAKGDDIQERLVEFAVRILRICNSLPKTRAARHVGDQLLRSGTAPAPNYAEARGAESTNDFVHKLKICQKELNESLIWLRIISKSEMLPESRLDAIVTECTELSRIINASIQTTLSRSHPNRSDKID